MLSYIRVFDPPADWSLGITVTAKDLTFKKDGFLRMRAQVRLKRDGVDHRSVSGAPDLTYIIDIPSGTYTAEALTKAVRIPSDTANVCVFIEGMGYRGEVYVEQPRLFAHGNNLLPSFTETAADDTHMDWTAQYISRKEWPEFRVRLNGKVIFTGEVFERCHRYSEWEIDLPTELLKSENTLSYELISDYRDPLPYTIYEMGVIEQPSAPLSVIAVSEAAPVDGFARVLVKTERADMTVKLECLSDAIEAKSEWHFREAGLHGILISCKKPCENAAFRLTYDGGEATGVIGRIVVRGKDKVITGTGDMIYVHQDERSMEEYLCWYISNHIGELVTVRPVYRWAGTRTINKKVWRSFRRLMDELAMKYVLMADGRELPGLATQPYPELSGGKGFLGSQLHERDGAQFYWGKYIMNGASEQQWANMAELAYNEDPDHTADHFSSANYIYKDGNMYMYADRSENEDYVLEHEKSVRALSAIRGDRNNRHTGPASTFKYMAEAGYKWLGAETMYQTMEPIMGFLRGTVKHFKMPAYGVHHAVQWSSTPHDSEAKYRRYRLALYASYMQGAHDINTEEGLWRIEEHYVGFNRFSDTCNHYLKEHKDFNRYVSTHTRSGRFYSPVALLHGRDDGITFFGKNKTWGQLRKQTPADDSWDLLTAIYPMCKPVQSIYLHPCPDDKPVGYHSGTPYGNIDILPTEAKTSVMSEYRAMAFLGYNRMTDEDAKRLISYVRRGGKLLLTDAHMTKTSVYGEIMSGSLDFGDGITAFTKGTPEFTDDSLNGITLPVCTNIKKPDSVLAYTDSGKPLVCSYRIGKGEVWLFHTKAYPSNEAIRSLYEAHLESIFDEACEKENVFAEVGDDVEFALYDQKDGSRHIYLLAVDWYNDPSAMRHAGLRIGDNTYAVDIPFGTMLKCVSKDGVGAFCQSEDGEVLSVSDDSITVQGTGSLGFTVLRNGRSENITADFSDCTVKTLSL